MKGFFVSTSQPPAQGIGPAWWFIFRNRKMLVSVERDRVSVPFLSDPESLSMAISRKLYLGALDGVDCYAGEVEGAVTPPKGMAFRGLREIHGHLDETLFKTSFRAIHTMDWDKTDRFCSRCGAKNESRAEERAKQCPACGFVSFPRMSPAVIVLVERDKKALLARSGQFPQGLFSTIAGFVEPGETLEDAVRREIREETSIEVKNIRYFGSQPWPFPDSLMIGFTAEYAGGEIAVDNNEIVDARWFSAHNLPEIPGKVSIARALIDWFLHKQSQ